METDEVKKWLSVMMITMTTTNWAAAQNAKPTEKTQRLPEVTVYGTIEQVKKLPDEAGGKIFSGKKTTATEFADVPAIVDNNLRQMLSQTPGVLVSETPTPGHINLNYRGIGDPHESEFLLNLKDGVPLMSDWFGDPTMYHTPPTEMIERIELIRGGSALLFGPQPGPVLNYVSFPPSRDRKFTASTQHAFGSDNLYSTHSQLNGTVGRFGYRGDFHHRQSDGPRDNADYDVYYGALKLVHQASDQTRWMVGLDVSDSVSGEAGRLTYAQYQADRDQTPKPHDRLWVQRYAPHVTFEHNFTPDTLLTVTGWAGYQDRFSRRQNGGGTATNLDRREFFYAGTDARARHFWQAWNNEHILTGGITFYSAEAPRSRETNPLLTATAGTPVFEMDRSTLYGAFFAENKFTFGRFAIIPAFRLELIELNARETFNTGVTRALIDERFTAVVPLFGVGATFDLGRNNELYANVSQGYRPPKYDDLANPTSNAQRPPSDLQEGETWNFELGIRGQPVSWFSYDASVFLTDFDNYIETRDLGGGNNERSNSGRAIYQGVELAAEVDVIGLYDAVAKDDLGKTIGSFNLFGNVALLDAEFVSGANDGNVPGYAPDYVVKVGAIYRHKYGKIAMTGQFVDDHFWQDSNAAGSVGIDHIPAYAIWDLTAEVKLYKNHVAVFGGVNNLFNEDYFSRVRSDGIEPAYERNFYGGIKLVF